MESKLCFVQFLHPGGEHRPDNGKYMSWNRLAHKRKFLKNYGQYVSNGKTGEGELVFWGEWEPQSEVIKELRSPIPHGPRYIYKPFYKVLSSYENLQNTDPFVFGDQFYYEGCQQRTKIGPTQLMFLKRGSVILFGSCISQQNFVLDTVFVMDEWIDHNRGNFRKVLAEAVPEAYKEITISPWYHESFTDSKSCVSSAPSDSWRLYFGATYKSPLNGMFSFFPCLPYEESTKGFARPVISIQGVITDNQMQGKKLNPQSHLDGVKTLWEEVVRQVEEQGLMLGVFTEIPRKVEQT